MADALRILTEGASVTADFGNATDARHREFHHKMEGPATGIGRRVAMAKPVKVQVLERARALIADERHWCPGTLARDARGFPVNPMDSGAEQRCALGALVAAAHDLTADPDMAHRLAASAMRPVVGATSLTHINDTEGHAAVLELLDRAIAAR